MSTTNCRVMGKETFNVNYIRATSNKSNVTTTHPGTLNGPTARTHAHQKTYIATRPIKIETRDNLGSWAPLHKRKEDHAWDLTSCSAQVLAFKAPFISPDLVIQITAVKVLPKLEQLLHGHHRADGTCLVIVH